MLGRLDGGARAVLGRQFAGLYLYGSLATGGFDPATSDIDFLVVTEGALDEAAVDALREMHEELSRDGGKWAAKLEGAYVARAALRKYGGG
jgi:predicted nucleotidyltransferase